MYEHTVSQPAERKINDLTALERHLKAIKANCTDTAALASINAEFSYTAHMFKNALTPAELNARRARLGYFRLVLKGVTIDNREAHRDNLLAMVHQFDYQVSTLNEDPVMRGIIERRGVAA